MVMLLHSVLLRLQCNRQRTLKQIIINGRFEKFVVKERNEIKNVRKWFDIFSSYLIAI